MVLFWFDFRLGSLEHFGEELQRVVVSSDSFGMQGGILDGQFDGVLFRHVGVLRVGRRPCGSGEVVVARTAKDVGVEANPPLVGEFLQEVEGIAFGEA